MTAAGPSFAGLLGSELRRALSRRLVRLLVLVAVVGLLIAGIVVFAKSSRTVTIHSEPAPGRVVNGVCQPVPFDEHKQAFEVRGEFCEAHVEVTRDHAFHLARAYQRERISESYLIGLAGPLIFAGLLAAASMIAVEWRFNTMAVLLTWEPRRLRVFVAKLLTVVIVSFLIAMLLELLLVLVLVPAGVWHGTTAGIDGAWYRSASWLAVRISGLTAWAAAMGFALGSLGRNTTAAMGSAFAYLLVGEAALRAAKPKWEGWFLSQNIAIVIDSGRGTNHPHSLGTAALLLLLYVTALCAAALAFFERRDVT